MNMFSLRTIIDDILLIVRNNNISESEDLSRDQIASWVMLYKAAIKKKKDDDDKISGDDENPSDDNDTTKIVEMTNANGKEDIDKDSCCSPGPCIVRMRSKKKLYLDGSNESSLKSVTDSNGCVIQTMSLARVHYHHFRRYTNCEPISWWDNGYLYIEGNDDIKNIKTVLVNAVLDPTEDAESEDDIVIPGWMIPQIKQMIMSNELRFMLNRPSDDSNNSTLASVKPHGPQDLEQ